MQNAITLKLRGGRHFEFKRDEKNPREAFWLCHYASGLMLKLHKQRIEPPHGPEYDLFELTAYRRVEDFWDPMRSITSRTLAGLQFKAQRA